jgi:hypothetical protein
VKERLYVAGVLAGVAAVAVLAVFLLGPGRFDPSPPSLADRPVAAIPGEILYVDRDNCVVRLTPATNAREQVYCGGPDVAQVSWLDGDTVGYGELGPGGPRWTELDPATGATRSLARFRRPTPPDDTSVKGERVVFDRDGSVFVVAGRDRRTVLDYDGPESLRPFLVTWSPDGEWLLLASRGELWVVSRGGAIRRTLAQTGPYNQTASWRIEGLGYLPKLELEDARR